MKTKNEIYVVVDTPKKAKKLKKVLDMFNVKWNINQFSGGFNCFYFDNDYLYSMEARLPLTEVSIKELKNILAIEHLKKGDVVVFKNGLKGKIVGFNGDSEIIVNDEDNDDVTCFIWDFIRYATEEEKQLLNPKKGLTRSDYKDKTWYKRSDNGCLFFLDKSKDSHFGFSINSQWWLEDIEWFSFFTHNDFNIPNTWKEATPQEVEKALIGEAKRRYKIGDAVTQLDEANIGNYPYAENGSNFKIRDIDEPLLQIDDEGTFFYLGNLMVFKNGRWAEIVEHAEEVVDKPKVGDVVKAWNGDAYNYFVGIVHEVTDWGDFKIKFRIGDYFGGYYFYAKHVEVLNKEQAIDLLFNE